MTDHSTRDELEEELGAETVEKLLDVVGTDALETLKAAIEKSDLSTLSDLEEACGFDEMDIVCTKTHGHGITSS